MVIFTKLVSNLLASWYQSWYQLSIGGNRIASYTAYTLRNILSVFLEFALSRTFEKIEKIQKKEKFHETIGLVGPPPVSSDDKYFDWSRDFHKVSNYNPFTGVKVGGPCRHIKIDKLRL